jgi:DivIVA domain-containing protein
MTEHPERPEFATAIRGYDRLQVDEYIDRLAEIAADAEERARAAEEELEFSRHATVGPRVGEIFDLAIEEAKELRERVAAEAETTRADARAEAEAILSRAEQEAADVEAQSRREREEALAELAAERGRARSEVEELDGTKIALIGDLWRLQEALAAAAEVAEGKSESTTEELEAPREGRHRAAAEASSAKVA